MLVIQLSKVGHVVSCNRMIELPGLNHVFGPVGLRCPRHDGLRDGALVRACRSEPQAIIAPTLPLNRSTALEPWTLRLRIPSWTDSATVKINGKQLEATPGGGSHFAISRAWRKGDRVELVVPMRLMSEPMPDDPAMQAFLFGPIVLSGDFGTQGLTEQLVGHQ
jgi:hypothetical protein